MTRVGCLSITKKRSKISKSTFCRKNGQVIGLEFVNLSPQAQEHVRAKIIRLEVEWMRMKPNF